MTSPWSYAQAWHAVEVLIPLLQHTEHWERRSDVLWYVFVCNMRGFCDTDDQIRLCAQRYIAGKRKFTPPGTERRKRLARQARRGDPALMTAVRAAIDSNPKAVLEYRQGNRRAANALVGAVLRQHKAEPAIVQQALINELEKGNALQ